MAHPQYLSELFRIVEGAIRLDGEKVKNYAFFLADKLENEGEKNGARRLRSIIENETQKLHPANIDQKKPLPVDGESRFPLLEKTEISGNVLNFIFSKPQEKIINDYLSVIESRAKLEANDIFAGTNLLLYGPPGCGKTHLARYIAFKLKLPLYTARIDGLISSFLGSTAKNIQAIFEYASKTPCILLLDEFDAIAKFRNDQQELGELKRVVNSFIQNLDSHSSNTLLIAATNHEKMLDPAIWRRFDFLLNVELPGLDQRLALWKLFADKLQYQEKHLKVLADLSEGYSGAAIKSVSSRLLQQLIISGTESTLRDSLKMLLSLKAERNGGNGVLSPEILDDLQQLKTNLSTRNSDLYSLSIIGEIGGYSKATMSRNYSKRVKTGNG
jgi:MoxR-like ATPase